MRKLTSHIETAINRTITATTGRITLARKLKRREALMRSMSVLGEILDAQGEIQFQVALFRHDHFLNLAGEAFMPSPYFVGAWRDVYDLVTAVLIGRREVRVFEHQND